MTTGTYPTSGVTLTMAGGGNTSAPRGDFIPF